MGFIIINILMILFGLWLMFSADYDSEYGIGAFFSPFLAIPFIASGGFLLAINLGFV